MQWMGFREKRVIAFKNELAPWGRIDVESMTAWVPHLIEKAKARIEALSSDRTPWSRQEFEAFEAVVQNLSELMSPLIQLSSVKDSEVVRATMESLEPQWSNFMVWKAHHYPAYAKHLESFREASLPSQADFLKALQLAIQESEKMGIQLSDEKKAQFKSLFAELVRLEREFGQNLLDAQNHTQVVVDDPKRLQGIPDDFIKKADQGNGHWIFCVDEPTTSALLKFADNEALREQIYRASSTLASEQSSFPQWDNSSHLVKIIQMRAQLSQLVGYPNFSSWQLDGNVLNTPEKVIGMVASLRRAIQPRFAEEKAQLNAFVTQQLGHSWPVKPWDFAYYRHLYLKNKYQIEDEAIRDYFPISQVLIGLMKTLHSLFGLSFRKKQLESVWAPEVRYFEFFDEQDNLVGGIYFDLFVRPGKHSGAWVNNLYGIQRNLEGVVRRPVMLLHTNFRPLNQEGESYLSHQEVVTLFHEMGHALQGILTRISMPSVSGLSGIPWDAIEIASQLFESWAWQPQVLKMLSRHRVTQEALPDECIERLIGAQKDLTALSLARQLLFCEFDMHLHQLDQEASSHLDISKLNALWKSLQAESMHPFVEAEFVRFPHQFSHLFSGGYASGYYGYLHSEMIARDFFETFLEHKDIFHRPTALAIRDDLFAQGAVGNPEIQLRHLRGRWPSMTPLLKWHGLA